MIIGFLVGVLVMSVLVGILFVIEDVSGSNDFSDTGFLLLGFTITLPVLLFMVIKRFIREKRPPKPYEPMKYTNLVALMRLVVNYERKHHSISGRIFYLRGFYGRFPLDKIFQYPGSNLLQTIIRKRLKTEYYNNRETFLAVFENFTRPLTDIEWVNTKKREEYAGYEMTKRDDYAIML